MKYDVIISNTRWIKGEAQRIRDATIFENKIDDRGVQNEGKPLKVKSYWQPHYQEILQQRKKYIHKCYKWIIWNTQQYSWNDALQNHYSTIYYQRLETKTNWISHNYNTWNQNYATTNYHKLRQKIIEFGWMGHHRWKQETDNIRKSYYLVSSHVNPLTANIFGGGYYVMIQGENTWG